MAYCPMCKRGTPKIPDKTLVTWEAMLFAAIALGSIALTIELL